MVSSSTNLQMYVMIFCLCWNLFLHAYDSILSCFSDIFCIHLGSPDNGYVSLSGNGPGSTATYGCNLGYVRVGTATRTCQDDGEWSGSEPSCRSKQKLVQEYMCVYNTYAI